MSRTTPRAPSRARGTPRPRAAALVVVGDVDPDDVMRRVEHHFGSIPAGTLPARVVTSEPDQLAEGRVRVERPGTAAYLKLAWHAPAVSDPDFHPMLVLDAALTGATGVNLWGSFRKPPQRGTRLHRAAVSSAGARAGGGRRRCSARCARPSIRSSTPCRRRSARARRPAPLNPRRR